MDEKILKSREKYHKDREELCKAKLKYQIG